MDDPAPLKSPRILIDVTGTAFHNVESGIPRFVREVAKEAYSSGDALPVVHSHGGLSTIYDGLEAQQPLQIENGEVLFVPDVNYQWIDEYIHLHDLLKAKDGRMVVFIHDIIPLLHPGTCYRELPQSFARWFQFVLDHADAIVTTTQAVANDIRNFLSASERSQRAIPIGWVPAGSSAMPLTFPPSDAMQPILKSGSFFLTVGTVEPRKGHSVILDAFDRLWAKGSTCSLLIIGHRGWGTRAVQRRIWTHEKYGTSLFWLDQASDADLAHAYAKCAALVIASLAEGFGLPLVEAATFGKHRIVSDLPAFHEVTRDENVSFFRTFDPADLADKIEQVMKCSLQKNASRLSPMSWTQSSADLFSMIRNKTFQLISSSRDET